jgi:hypothetical protein
MPERWYLINSAGNPYELPGSFAPESWDVGEPQITLERVPLGREVYDTSDGGLSPKPLTLTGIVKGLTENELHLNLDALDAACAGARFVARDSRIWLALHRAHLLRGQPVSKLSWRTTAKIVCIGTGVTPFYQG